MNVRGLCLGLWCAGTLLGNAAPDPIRLVYFCPAGMEPHAGYVARLDRVMTHIQDFYRAGMEQEGLGKMTFALERVESGELQVHVVRGSGALDQYDRDRKGSFGQIRQEVQAHFREQGMDPRNETLLVFTPLLLWEGKRTREFGPYAGSGNHLHGFCLAYDDPKLDPEALASKEPGGFFRRPCSWGMFNTAYIGGIAHELGHALGLPHVREQTAEKKRGTSLMSSGNLTWGNELRGEGTGTFLCRSSALILAGNRRFAGDLPGARQPVRGNVVELSSRWEKGALVLEGRVEAIPAATHLILRNDLVKKPDSYEAVGWTAPVDAEGRFRIQVGEIRPGAWQLLGRICHRNGAGSTFTWPYQTNEAGVPDVEVLAGAVRLQRAFDAFGQNDMEALRRELNEMEQDFKGKEIRRKIAHLRRLTTPQRPRELGAVDPGQTSVSLSDLVWREAKVGWGRVHRDRVLIERPGQSPLLTVKDEFFEKGIFAHAAARTLVELDGTWNRFTTRMGLQDGHSGSVVFVIRGDGRELFRSPRVEATMLLDAEVELEGVRLLELVVEDGGDGPGADWAVWLDPLLHRT